MILHWKHGLKANRRLGSQYFGIWDANLPMQEFATFDPHSMKLLNNFIGCTCSHLLFLAQNDFSIKNEKMVSLCSDETQPLQLDSSTLERDSNLWSKSSLSGARLGHFIMKWQASSTVNPTERTDSLFTYQLLEPPFLYFKMQRASSKFKEERG